MAALVPMKLTVAAMGVPAGVELGTCTIWAWEA